MDMINMIYPQPQQPSQQLAELSHHQAMVAPKTYMELGSASTNGGHVTSATGSRPPGMSVIANNNNGKDLSSSASGSSSVKDGLTVLGSGTTAPPGVAATPESILDDGGELRLEVTCGQNQAVLYTGRLQLGSKGTCILFENAWLTPNEFQYVSGRETAKDWKRSIKHHGKSLKVLIAKGILTTTPPARCDCGQCNSSPRKDKIDGWKPNGADGSGFLSPSGDSSKQSTDCGDTWRSAATSHVPMTSSDGGTSAFRPPPTLIDGLPPSVYRNDCSVAAAADRTSGSFCGGSDDASSPRSMASKSGLSNSENGVSSKRPAGTPGPNGLKRSRSPSAGGGDQPQSKQNDAALMQHRMSMSESSLCRGEHQSRINGTTQRQQQFSSSSSTSSERRRDHCQNSSSASTSGQCRNGQQQSSGFKSPAAPPTPHHHYSNNGQKSSPPGGIAVTGAGTDRCHGDGGPCVISPLAATPYFPFLAAAAAATSTAAAACTAAPPVCYPNPYMMLPFAAAAAAYQNPTAAQFPMPYGWNGSSSASISDQSSRHHSSAVAGAAAGATSGGASGPAFDFPWMRGGGAGSYGGSMSSKMNPAAAVPPSFPAISGDPYEQLAKQSSTFGFGSASAAAQSPYAGYYRGGSTAGLTGLLAAAAADGLGDVYDSYLRTSLKAPGNHLSSNAAAAAAAAAGFQQSLFDSQHGAASASAAAAAAGFGMYSPLFQTPYFGIPSR